RASSQPKTFQFKLPQTSSQLRKQRLVPTANQRPASSGQTARVLLPLKFHCPVLPQHLLPAPALSVWCLSHVPCPIRCCMYFTVLVSIRHMVFELISSMGLIISNIQLLLTICQSHKRTSS